MLSFTLMIHPNKLNSISNKMIKSLSKLVNSKRIYCFDILSYLQIKTFCRKNFVFLFGVLVGLVVGVEACFCPIRMTYAIQPGLFSRAAPNWGKPAKHSLPQKLSKWADVITVCSHFSSSITPRHLVYGPLESSLLDQGFPIEYKLDEFNLPHTGTTKSPLQLWLCRLLCKIPLRQPGISHLGNILWRYSHFFP